MATIDRRGQGQFRARIRRPGAPALTRTFPTKALAEAWARSIETSLDAGDVVLSPEAQRTTLAEAFERYGKEVSQAKRGAAQELRRIRAWIGRPLAKKPLAAIRGADVARFRDERLAQVGPDSVRLELALLSHVFKIARTEWGMEGLGNPCEHVRKPKPGQARDRRLAPDEAMRLLKASPPLLQCAITLALETAMRRSELAGMRWELVDLRARLLKIPVTKNGNARTVPLSAAAVAALEALPRRMDGYVLGWPATVRDDLTHAFGGACKATGIAGLRFHDLRHEAISRLFERGWSVAEVAAVSGHSTWSQLRRYTQLRPEHLVAKLDRPTMLAA